MTKRWPSEWTISTPFDLPPLPYHRRMSGIYVLQMGDRGPLKIGWSQNVLRRLSSHQTSCPDELRLLLVLMARQYHESQVHAFFKADRKRGEWFRTGGAVSRFVSMKREELGPSHYDPISVFPISYETTQKRVDYVLSTLETDL